MAIDKHVENLFGSDVLTYFKNKQRGGANNQKGAKYENLFAVMQLADLFYLLANENAEDIEIHTQAAAFVDDLVILDSHHNSQRHFQLKNKTTVTWGAAIKSICDDFHKQKLLNDDISIENTKTYLVCSNQTNAQTLKQSIPDSISNFSDVIFFPEAQTINQLILIYPEFKIALERICFSNESDKLEALATILLGHWANQKTTEFSGKKLLSGLENIFPNYLAKAATVAGLMPQVKNIFSTITHFEYKIENGYFSWNYANLDSGFIPYPVDSHTFIEFQRKVIAKHPNQFSELEGILL